MKQSLLVCLLCVSLSPAQPSSSPYRFDASADYWILGSSALAGAGAFIVETNLKPVPSSEIASLHKNDINPIDRVTAGYYSKGESTASDVLVGVTITSPLLLLMEKDIRRDFYTLAVMYAETEGLSGILPSLGKGTAKRIRPYVYNTDVPQNLRTEPDAQRSFFSRHATFAFSTAVLTSIVYGDYFPNSKYRPYIWAGSLGLATSVSVLRVTSGSHFISDVVVGAAVGSAVGYIIPYIHRNSLQSSTSMSVAPLLSPPIRGISISLRF